LVSVGLERLAPLLGGAVIALLGGILIRAAIGMPPVFEQGLAFMSKSGLQLAVVLLGAGMSLGDIRRTGAESILVLLATVVFGVGGIFFAGRALRIDWNLRALISVGTSICGGSAIAALAPAIRAKQDEVSFAISTVFLMNIIAVVVFPPVGHLLGMSERAFGLWAGTAINDTSSVVAAAYSFGERAGDYATIVKLTRTTMIVPLVLIFGMLASWRRPAAPGGGQRWYRAAPVFLLWFLLAAALKSIGLLDALGLEALPTMGRFLIVAALSAIGLGTDLGQLSRTGTRPVLLGAAGWLFLAALSLGLMSLTGWM
jgi:uncharacterized integral membrane protein (TIGR00698 family)